MGVMLRSAIARSSCVYNVPTPVSTDSWTYVDTYLGTNTATLGAHQVGDVFVAWVIRDGSSTSPVIPSGWTTIVSTGANALGYCLVWKVAATTGETCGTFTNATSLVVDHIRPRAGWTVSVGITGTSSSSSSTTATFPAVTFQNTDDTSLLLAYLGHRSPDVTVNVAPTGMVTNDYTVDATDAASSYRVAAPTSAWPQQTVALGGTASTVRTYMLEMKFVDGVPVNVPTGLTVNVVGSDITISWTDTNAGGAQHRIDVSSDNSSFAQLVIKDAGINSHTITSASPGTTYYKVRAQIGASSSAFTTSASGTVSASGWQLAAGHYETAKIAMEIIAPRAGLSTTNRYYKAYPGLEYRVPVAVLGGAWPFRYELTAAPSGMTIGETYGSTDYGIINWTNPVTSGSPHTVTVRVTDQAGTQVTVTYTLTVTTTGFIFIDAVNGSPSSYNGGTGTGTISNPFQTINDWYHGDGTWDIGSSVKYNNDYSGYFVYYKNGTYNLNATFTEDIGVRVPFVSDYKPKVHLKYPGHEPVINTNNIYWVHYSEPTGNIFHHGLTFDGTTNSNKIVQWESGQNDIVLFENTYAEQTSAGVGENSSILFTSNASVLSNYVAIIGNTFANANGRDVYLGYWTNKGVIENNTISNNNWHGIYLKINYRYWSIRNNHGTLGNTDVFVRIDTYSTAADVEICWNNYKTTTNAVLLGWEAGAVSNISDYRNTWQVAYNNSLNPASGNWDATRNVVRHNGSYTQGYRVEAGGVTITRTELLAATTGLIDTTTGLLTGADRTTYLGIRGHEVA